MSDPKSERYANALESLARDYDGFELAEAMRAGAAAIRALAVRSSSSGTIDEEDVWRPGR